MNLKILNVHEFRGLYKNRKYLKFEQHRIHFFGFTEAHVIYGRKNTDITNALQQA